MTIKAEKLNFEYPDKAGVLKNVNFTIKEGSRCGIIGPNGAGKTTLFQLMCGLLRPSSGKILINGEEVRHTGFNPSIGYIFQKTDDMLFNSTVYEDISFGPINLNLPENEVASRTEDAMNVTGTSHLKERASHHLSAGEKRMVAIASVISMKPDILIYDEPSSDLDMRARRKLIDFINNSPETLLIASHDLEFILETCNYLILINDGSIVCTGNPAEIMNNEKLMIKNSMERPHSLLHGVYHSH